MRGSLSGILTPLIDNQIFYLITGYSVIGGAAAARENHFSEEEFNRYRHLEILRTEANVATELLANSYVVSDASFVEPLRERFESAQSRIERSLFALADAPFYAELAPIFEQLFALESVFELRARQLRLIQHQDDLLASNNDLANELLGDVEGLVSAASASVEEATQASTQAILTGRLLLLAIGLISIGGRPCYRVGSSLAESWCAALKCYQVGCAIWPVATWRQKSRLVAATR